MKTFTLAFALSALSTTFAQPRSFEGSRPPSGHQLNMNLQLADVINDDFNFTYKTIQPSFFYRYQSQRGTRVSSVIGFLYNRFDFAQGLNKDLALMFGAETFILISGDTPRVNGVELNQYEYNAHRFPFYLGAQYTLSEIALQTRLSYEMEYWSLYDRAQNAQFVAPDLSFEHGPHLRILWGRSGGPEVNDSGSRLLALFSWRHRPSHKSWGDASHLKNISQYIKASLGATSYIPTTDRIDTVLRIQSSFVNQADRLNALRSGSFGQEASVFGLDDERTDRAASGEFGIRYYGQSDRLWALKAFGSVVAYREILPTRRRNNFGAGPGLKFMQKIEPAFSWDLQYAALMGTRDDLSALHHLKLSASYRFF